MNLFTQADADKIARLKAAGWFCVDLWGQKAWRSPDGRQTTLYTDTAIQWMEEANAQGQAGAGDKELRGYDPGQASQEVPG